MATGGLALAERYYSSRIGEGVIFDLRAALFDHVQRMPLAFFTRTQTGALTSRLNNDVIGAQQALTGTLGSVVSNVITLVTVVGAMAFLDWRLTLLSLVLLPLFILPAKRVGRRLQAITREQMDLNASMNATMTERFNVAGALLVKLFGRSDDESRSFAERADGVRDTGVRAALYGRVFFVALALVGAIGTAAVYWVGGLQVIGGHALGGHARGARRLRHPALRAAHRAHQRPGRPDDARSCRSSGSSRCSTRPSRSSTGPGAVDLVGAAGRDRARRRVVPLPAATRSSPRSSSSATARRRRSARRRRRRGSCCGACQRSIEPGQLVALVGPSGAGKSTLASSSPGSTT